MTNCELCYSHKVRPLSLAKAVDEEILGHRNQRGEWAPRAPLEYPPIFVWPPKPRKLATWFRGYLFSWNLLYAVIALGIWLFLTPSLETAESFGTGWVLPILIRNAVIVVVFYSLLHIPLYVRRSQGETFKYKPGWPKIDSRLFLFRNQTRDNVFWTLCSGVPIWTAYECFMLWAFSNGHITSLTWDADAFWIILLMLLVPVWRDPHFFVTHRLLHSRALYRRFHKLHHSNTNPGPWSGLAMHPVEHVLYFSGVLIHFIVPASPVVLIYQLVHSGLAPAPGHLGYEKMLVPGLRDARQVNSEAFNHYLHHKYFECNYSDGVFPLDKWFGTFNDGSPEARAAMQERLARRGHT